MNVLTNVVHRLGWAAPLGFAIGWANLAVLGALIGWAGGSRAFGTGLHTLFRDHLGAYVASILLTVAVAAIAGRASGSRQIGAVCLFVLVADIVAGLFVVAAIGEITIGWLPQVLFTQTVAGTQLVAVLIGLLLGARTRDAAGP